MAFFVTVSSANALEELTSWKYINRGAEGEASIVSKDKIGISLVCKNKKSPMNVGISIPKGFVEDSKTIWVTLETNSPFTISEWRQLQKKKLAKRADSEEDKPEEQVVHFSAHQVEIDDKTHDIYLSDLSRRYDGKLMLRVLRDAWTKMRLTIEYRKLSENATDYDIISGSVLISSTNSTSSFRKLNINHCGI